MRRGRVGGGQLEVYEPSEEEFSLTPGQFAQRLIRLRQWSRVKALSLGPSKGDIIKVSRYTIAEQPAQPCLCDAPLSPD